MKEQIEFTEFLEIEKKLEIKVGLITAIEEVPKSSKLIKLTVNFGFLDRAVETEESMDIRTVVTNIKPILAAIGKTEEGGNDYPWRSLLINQNFLFITNLKPVVMMGIESTAMILPGEIESRPIISVNGWSGTIVL